MLLACEIETEDPAARLRMVTYGYVRLRCWCCVQQVCFWSPVGPGLPGDMYGPIVSFLPFCDLLTCCSINTTFRSTAKAMMARVGLRITADFRLARGVTLRPPSNLEIFTPGTCPGCTGDARTVRLSAPSGSRCSGRRRTPGHPAHPFPAYVCATRAYTRAAAAPGPGPRRDSDEDPPLPDSELACLGIDDPPLPDSEFACLEIDVHITELPYLCLFFARSPRFASWGRIKYEVRCTCGSVEVEESQSNMYRATVTCAVCRKSLCQEVEAGRQAWPTFREIRLDGGEWGTGNPQAPSP